MEIVPPTTPQTHTIIFLHGRGSNGPEFESEFFESQASNKMTLPEMFPHVKWVCCAHNMSRVGSVNAADRSTCLRSELNLIQIDRSFHLQRGWAS